MTALLPCHKNYYYIMKENWKKNFLYSYRDIVSLFYTNNNESIFYELEDLQATFSIANLKLLYACVATKLIKSYYNILLPHFSPQLVNFILGVSVHPPTQYLLILNSY